MIQTRMKKINTEKLKQVLLYMLHWSWRQAEAHKYEKQIDQIAYTSMAPTTKK